MDLFRSSPKPGPASPQQNPTVPSSTTPVPTSSPTGENKSPIANYEKLWEKGETAPAPAPSLVPALNMDPQKLREGASKIDFVGQIPAEQVQKAMSGDAQAFLDVINKTAQLSFAQAVAAGAEVTKQSLTSAQDSLNTQILPQAMRNQAIDNALAENPAFTNPAVAPLLENLKTQLAAKYPTASAGEIAKHAQEYLKGVSELVTGQKVAQEAPSRNSQLARPETDWEKFFSF